MNLQNFLCVAVEGATADVYIEARVFAATENCLVITVLYTFVVAVAMYCNFFRLYRCLFILLTDCFVKYAIKCLTITTIFVPTCICYWKTEA